MGVGTRGSAGTKRGGAAFAAAIAISTMTACGGVAAEDHEQWQREAIPSPTNVTSELASVATGGGATWAFGGAQRGMSGVASEGYRRDATGRWREVAMPDSGEITDSVVVSDSDVWAASDGPGGPVHWDGARWTTPPVPPGWSGSRASLARIGGQVWAVGSYTGAGREPAALAMRWDGGRWIDVQLPGPAMDRADAVTGSSPEDVWVVGRAENRAKAMHWNGAGWAESPLPTPDSVELADVTATGDREVTAVGSRWANGDQPVVLRWDGESWSEKPVRAANTKLAKVDRAGDETWAVGEGGSMQMQALRDEGGEWRPVPGTPEGFARDATTLPDGRPLLIGNVPYAENLAVARES